MRFAFSLCLAWMTAIASASLVMPTHRAVPQATGLRTPAHVAARAAIPIIMQVSSLATLAESKHGPIQFIAL